MKERILYLECKTGAAGDMLMGALYELLSEENKQLFLDTINAIHPEIAVSPCREKKYGIGGVHMCVRVWGEEEHVHHAHSHAHDEAHDHTHVHTHTHDTAHAHGHHARHAHTSCSEILSRIASLPISEEVREDAAKIYRILAAAEGKVHETTMEQIHFHEVGSLDAMADIVGCCLAIRMLAVDKIIASPVCLGNGTVRCAHGILPVPAPATAEIIKGMPAFSGDCDGEMLTPTGAALLKYFVGEFKKEMEMTIDAVGYGFGTKDFGRLSCVRAFLGESFL